MKRYNITQMRKHYEHWQSSGLGKKVYATQAGIPVSTFYYWVSKLEKQSAAPAPEGFQAVQLDLAPSVEVRAIVRYPGGVSIEWQGPAQSLYLLKTLP